MATGSELIRFAQKHGYSCKFLVLSALGELQERVEGLDLGADDYMVKPFEPEELLARIRAAERRPAPEVGRVLEIGSLRLDCDTRNFYVGAEAMILPRREMVILEELMHGANRVVATRSAGERPCTATMNNTSPTPWRRTCRACARRSAARDCGVRVHTVRGVGYMLREES